MKNKKICLLLAGTMLVLGLSACGGDKNKNDMNDMVSSESDYTTDTSSTLREDNDTLLDDNTTNNVVDHEKDSDFNNSVTEGTDDIHDSNENENDSLGEDIMDGVDNMMDDARAGVRNITDGLTR